jgi:hypothetical protein
MTASGRSSSLRALRVWGTGGGGRPIDRGPIEEGMPPQRHSGPNRKRSVRLLRVFSVPVSQSGRGFLIVYRKDALGAPLGRLLLGHHDPPFVTFRPQGGL